MAWLSNTRVRRWRQHWHSVGEGHVYKGRYKSFPVEKSDYFLTLARYVEANPRRAKVVERAQDWRWSSLGGSRSPDGRELLTDWPAAKPRNWLKSAYDANADGVSDVPIEANTAADAIKEAVEGEYTATWGHCTPGGPTEHTYTFPGDVGVADTSTDPVTDGGEAYNIVMTEESYSGIWNGSIHLRADWVNPELVYPEDKYYVGVSWSVTADPTAKVWVSSTDVSASEDDRDESIVTISREGGDLATPLTVHFSLGGTASTSLLAESSYPDGIAADGADYTVGGAVFDDNAWSWTATIPANASSVDVTVKPLNDSLEETTETVAVSLAGDPDGVNGGAYGFFAPPATGPATKPTSIQMTLDGLTLDIQQVFPLEGTPPTQTEKDAVRDSLEKCDSATGTIRDAGSAELLTAFRTTPLLMAYGQSVIEMYGPEAQSRFTSARLQITAELQPFTISIANGTLSVVFAANWSAFPEFDSMRLFVYTDDAEILTADMMLIEQTYENLAPTATQSTRTVLIPKKSGSTKLRIIQQFRTADPNDPNEQVLAAPSRTFAWDVTVAKKI